MKKNTEKKFAEIIFCICGIMTIAAIFALFFSVGAMVEAWKISIIPFAVSVFCLAWLVAVVVVVDKAKG